MNISSSVVVITGGAKGLGKSLAEIFKKDNANVIICDNDKATLSKTVSLLDVNGFFVNVTDEQQVIRMSKKIVANFGSIDIWINNAGIWMPRQALEEVDVEKGEKLFNTNVFGTIHGMRAAIRQMKLQKYGTILNIISTTAFDGMNGSSGSVYVAAKYALRGLTNSVREELKNFGISVLGIYPSGMKTNLFDEAQPNSIGEFMSSDEVALKIISNLRRSVPKEELIIKRPHKKQS